MSPQEIKAQKLTDIYRALLAILSRQPMATITISALCQQANVSRTYFYREFGDFETIINKYQERAIFHYIRQLPDHQLMGLQDAMVYYFQYVADSADEQRLLVRCGRTTTLIRTFEHAFTRLITTQRLTNSERLAARPYYVQFLAAGVVNMSISWLKAGMPETPKQMAYQIKQYGNLIN
ncbi:TetR/AcrR family transcriptional regulator [Lactiplantibacillus carotarum]|uniref:TetR/AcrR family transcriptional regulator n=1 Tax=Lactiplantibacillus carotarum TaxID=2993456 RepID=UPI00298F15D2|nr:TetR-like C-terminal domain-containing protein [Lactiplantibacillus carotarum]